MQQFNLLFDEDPDCWKILEELAGLWRAIAIEKLARIIEFFYI